RMPSEALAKEGKLLRRIPPSGKVPRACPRGSMILKNARKILRFLSRKKDVLSPLLIMMHDYPDPDAIASAYALHYLAEREFGVQTRIVYRGIIGRMENRSMVSILKLPIHKLRSGDLKRYPHVALLDTQPGFENNCFPLTRRAQMVIDQHPSIARFTADLSVIDPECGATSVILAQALLSLKREIPVPVATALAYGILTDTMNLYRARQPDISQIYLNILSHSDMRILARIQNPLRSRRFFTSLGRGIHQATVRRGLILSHLGAVESPDLVAQVADFLLSYKGMNYAACTGRYKGKLYVSLRMQKMTASAPDILRDVFTNPRNAGGHGLIAGGSFTVGANPGEENWEAAEGTFTERLMKRLRIPLKGDLYYPFRPT
ncbi:MAG: DHH family phosphoesterase, partial [Candidatus Omnitrophica bacterium]|nr:DHH family phosphoesterase [Candidatus Omnitrophota bacterium]